MTGHRPRLRLVDCTLGNTLLDLADEFNASVMIVKEPPAPRRRLPPRKPRRPAAAVRKSLRRALAKAATLSDTVRDADARCPAKARRAVHALQANARQLQQLADELQLAVECEINYHLWRSGRPYVE